MASRGLQRIPIDNTIGLLCWRFGNNSLWL